MHYVLQNVFCRRGAEGAEFDIGQNNSLLSASNGTYFNCSSAECEVIPRRLLLSQSRKARQGITDRLLPGFLLACLAAWRESDRTRCDSRIDIRLRRLPAFEEFRHRALRDAAEILSQLERYVRDAVMLGDFPEHGQP